MVPLLKAIALMLALLGLRAQTESCYPLVEVTMAGGRKYMKRMHALCLEFHPEHANVVTGQHLREQATRLIQTGERRAVFEGEAPKANCLR